MTGCDMRGCDADDVSGGGFCEKHQRGFEALKDASAQNAGDGEASANE